MWRRRDWSRLRKCSGAERLLLAEAVLWLGLSRAATLTLPFRWTVRLFALQPEAEPLPDNGRRNPAAVLVAWALRAAASRTPWQSTCLAQALAGARMLQRRKIACSIALGVARSAQTPESLEAHAWLSCGNEILTGAAGSDRYNVVARFALRAPV